MAIQLIITHPGSAHFDDITAISLVLAANPGSHFRIERREPTDNELENPAIWVIDVGDRYEPAKRNFDHHQSLDCPAGFVLVAQYLGLLETLSIFPWWDFKDHVDRFGPVRASRQYNAGDDLINRNPVEDWLVSRFVSDPQAALPWLKSFGTYLVENARQLKKQVDFWKTCPRIKINGVTALVGDTVESYGLEEFRRVTEDPPDIIISKDRRSDGWRLFRFEGAPVDFTRIANHPDIEFAHKSGFLAKTKTHLTIDDLRTLISQAVIGS